MIMPHDLMPDEDVLDACCRPAGAVAAQMPQGGRLETAVEITPAARGPRRGGMAASPLLKKATPIPTASSRSMLIHLGRPPGWILPSAGVGRTRPTPLTDGPTTVRTGLLYSNGSQ